jgi:hypothetical protein
MLYSLPALETSLPFLEPDVVQMTSSILAVAVEPIQIQVWARKQSRLHPLHAPTTDECPVDAAACCDIVTRVAQRVHELTLQSGRIIHKFRNLSQKIIILRIKLICSFVSPS